MMFYEVLKSVIEDGAKARREVWKHPKRYAEVQYIYKLQFEEPSVFAGESLLVLSTDYGSGIPYTPQVWDLFGDDWEIVE